MAGSTAFRSCKSSYFYFFIFWCFCISLTKTIVFFTPPRQRKKKKYDSQLSNLYSRGLSLYLNWWMSVTIGSPTLWPGWIVEWYVWSLYVLKKSCFRYLYGCFGRVFFIYVLLLLGTSIFSTLSTLSQAAEWIFWKMFSWSCSRSHAVHWQELCFCSCKNIHLSTRLGSSGFLPVAYFPWWKSYLCV